MITGNESLLFDPRFMDPQAEPYGLFWCANAEDVQQQRAVMGKYWHDLTVDKKTLNAAMKRLRHPDCSRRLKAYL